MDRTLVLCALLASLLTATVIAEPLQIASLQTSAMAGNSLSNRHWADLNPGKLKLKSASALIVDSLGNEVYAKQVDQPMPIASITKLMTAMVILDASLPMQERISITKDDRDLIKHTGSRLKYGATLTRDELVRVMLMASENRAANALARTFPGGKTAFIDTMNRKARELGMNDSRFAGPAGLNPENIASARDVVKMVQASLDYPLIREATTTRSISVYPYKKSGELRYNNTNRLLRNEAWSIEISKTGYLREAGRCLTMQVELVDEPLIIVLLNSYGKLTPYGDSNRIRKWMENQVKG